MAQTIIGLDIGSFSVKVVTMTASFRSMSWTGFREYEIPHGERDRPHRKSEVDQRFRGHCASGRPRHEPVCDPSIR